MKQVAPKKFVERSHLFNTFFFSKLRSVWEEGHDDSDYYGKVKKWVQKIDIFNKDFLIVPVNERSHWYLIIMCFPGRVKSKVKKEEPGLLDSIISAMGGPSGALSSPDMKNTPRILILDSLNINRTDPKKEGYAKKSKITKKLRVVLQELWKERNPGIPKTFDHNDMPDLQLCPPKQPNSYDCGLYLLKYVETFTKESDFILDRRANEKNVSHWFDKKLIKRMRKELKDLILELARQIKSGEFDLNHIIVVTDDTKAEDSTADNSDASISDDDVVEGGSVQNACEILELSHVNSTKVSKNVVQEVVESIVDEIDGQSPTNYYRSTIVLNDSPKKTEESEAIIPDEQEKFNSIDENSLMSEDDDDLFSENPIPSRETEVEDTVSIGTGKNKNGSMTSEDKKIKKLQEKYQQEDLINGDSSIIIPIDVESREPSPKRSCPSNTSQGDSEDEITILVREGNQASPPKKFMKTKK